MLEIIIQGNSQNRNIALVENGNLIEYYEESKEIDRKEGNIYIGEVKNIIPGMQSAFIDIGTEKSSFIHLKDILPKIDETKGKFENDKKIEDVLKKGQKLLVQIKKDSNEKKGARVSTHINLPGKYIALMPNTDIITISQKISDEKEKNRLKEIVRKNLDKENGAIVRTAAKGKESEIINDIKVLQKKWKKILNLYQKNKENDNKLLYKSEDITEKMLIDLTYKKIEKVIVDNDQEYSKIEEFKKQNIEYQNLVIEKRESVFDIYEINHQIEKLMNRKVWLKCGGFITIDNTEALTAIDVNTGKYTGNKSLEQTIFKVNKEATKEIAKQLRLRDIGGIIIIDYIDMKNKEESNKIQELLEEELKKDRAKTQVEGFTKLELMELTRKHICSHKK